ncbi:MAG: molybdenum cofactor guanylyltransferase [Deltaproteobacteria bacterium]|nr:molybdenum cofactor guanylyltransferase [Deltaproteobacteria bacterium]
MVARTGTLKKEFGHTAREGKSRQKIHDVTGVILAGGKSNRYGENKALVKFEGIPLIQRVIDVLDGIFPRLIIITNTPSEYSHLGLPMYEDLIKELGPIGGIYTGLNVMEGDLGFFVACDMPFLNEGFIRHMVSCREDYDAVIPRVDWKIEALHSVYHRRLIPVMKEHIDLGLYQVIRVFSKIRVKYVDEEEIRAFDPELKTFININRPDDLVLNLNQPEGDPNHG